MTATAHRPAPVGSYFEGVDTRTLEGYAVSIWDMENGDMLAYRVEPTESKARALGIAILWEMLDSEEFRTRQVGFEVLENPTF